MKVTPGATDVTTYMALVLSSDGSDATGLTITDLDLQYVRSGAAPVAKVDATALAATDSAHSDNTAIEIDATDQPGLYRVDWPDAAFAAGVREVVLTLKHSSCRASHLRVELETVQTGDSFARLGAPAGASVSADIAAIEAQTDDIGAAGAGLSAIPWNASWDAEVQSEVADALAVYDPPTKAETDAAALTAWTTALTEAYAADGAAFTPAQGLFMIWSLLAERAISGTTLTASKLDGTTAAMTFTLDDATTPNSQTRAT